MKRSLTYRGPALDALLDAIVMEAHLTDGLSSKVVAGRTGTDRRAWVILRNLPTVAVRNAPWSPEEEAYLRENLGRLTDAEMGRVLGRSPNAVHLHRERDMDLPAPSKNPRELTGEQVAQGLRIDSKAAARLIDRGILPGRELPGTRRIRVVDRQVFLRWLLNPENWIYFKPLRVGPRKPQRAAQTYDGEFWRRARKLVCARYQQWDDAWWRIGRVARYLKVNHQSVNQAIRRKKLPAKDWGNWWVLRSAAQGYRGKIVPGKGSPGQSKGVWTERADAFIVLALGVGLSYNAIAAMMHGSASRTRARIGWLRSHDRLIRRLIRKFQLQVRYNPTTRKFTADWRRYRRRFKRYAAIRKKHQAGEKLTPRERAYLSGPAGRVRASCSAETIARAGAKRLQSHSTTHG